MAKPIDPHSVFINGESVKHEDLTFFVQLNVTKRNRLGSSISDKPLVINFLGTDENGNFTTNWTENEENFGIKSINFKMLSSYVPQVDIVFEDVRGQALLNKFNNSKYAVLFDMPPPIFDLTIKGYYGQSVTYRLHLLKQSTKFVNNNSFEISSSFVGMTFAPLADMYVDYLEVAPYISGEKRSFDDFTYLELTEKSKQLTSQVKQVVEKDVKTINDLGYTNSNLMEVKDNYVQRFIDDLNNQYTGGGSNYIFLVNRKTPNSEIVEVSFKYIVKGTSPEKRYPRQDVYDSLVVAINNKKSFFAENNLDYKIIQDVKSYSEFSKTKYTFTEDQYVKMFEIDLTGMDKKIRDRINNNLGEIESTGDKVKQSVNNVVSEVLAGGPTLDRVLRIIMKDAKSFFTTLKNVVTQAEKDRVNDNDTSNGDAPKFAFPNYYTNDKVTGKRVKSIPLNEDWAEVQFVNNYINAKLTVEDYKTAQQNINFDPTTGSAYTFGPINAFDTLLDSTNIFNNLKTPADITSTLIRRGWVGLTMYRPPLSINGLNKSETDAKIMKTLAKIDAKNLMTVLRTRETLLNAYLEVITKESFSFLKEDPDFYNKLNSGTLYQIEGATASKGGNMVTYSLGNNFRFKTIDDFSEMGVPVTKSSVEFDDTELKILNDLIIESNSAIKYFSENTNGSLCQYNVPFFYDSKYKNKFENKSDYFNRNNSISRLLNKFGFDDEIFNYQSSNKLSAITDADTFLKTVFYNESFAGSSIIHPFDVEYTNYSSIIAIPKFVLICWGFVLDNLSTIKNSHISAQDKARFGKMNNNLKSTLVQFYRKYKSEFNGANGHGDIRSDFKIKLISVEGKIDDREEFEQTLYDTRFMKDFLEIQYVVIGDRYVFSDIRNKAFIGDLNVTANSKVEDIDTFYSSVYFTALKQEILRLKTDVQKDITNQKSIVKSRINNSDLRTELYYNFKSFVDKWMLNTPDNVTSMFSKSGDDLENFLMVDRAFNNIGEQVMIDLTPIYSTETTPDTSIYTLLLNLLSKNNFEFFALPSYIDYGKNGILWSPSNVETVFGPHFKVNTNTRPKFICMYVGGTSSQLDVQLGFGNSHEDDSGKLEIMTDLNDSQQVQAFEVNFGSGNQSFFHGLELDQLEFKETNESIKLLDVIAGSDPNVTNNATNSLFNVYEQRSYTATFQMMGNVMIQPTMYFELTNVALFKGTYLILEVYHDITGNNITTTFKGVRIPKIPKPFVTDYTIYANIDGLDPAFLRTSNTTSGRISAADVKDIKSALDGLGKIKTTKLNNKEKALLDVLAYAEGTLEFGNNNGYDCIVTSKKIELWKPDYQLGHGLDSWYQKSANSTAAGRYQFLGSTWLGISKGTDSLGGGDYVNKNGNRVNNKAFSAENQDLTANAKINERLKPRNLVVSNINESNWVLFIDALALEWASLPYYKTIMKDDPRSDKFKQGNKSWTAGKGFYAGQGGRFSKEELWLVFSLALKKYEGKTITDADVDSIVQKVNEKVGDTTGYSDVDKKLKIKYGNLDILHENMTAGDRKTTLNNKFIQNNIVSWHVPSDIRTNIPAFPTVVEINTIMQVPLERVLRELITLNLHKEIKTMDGTFNIRFKRQSNTPSTHSYGLAIDLNAATNQQGHPVTFSAAFLQVWRNNNFTCGADFRGKCIDGMHFEYTKII